MDSFATRSEPNSQEMKNKSFHSYRYSVAPMMDWTDRHCRYFHRLMSRYTLLYTEMVSASAIVKGDIDRLLAHDRMEYPLALQIGGAEPRELSEAVDLCADRGFYEINLNAGCPSSKVQEGCFGVALMQDRRRVAECLEAMQQASRGIEVTIKCRLGVDDQNPHDTLPLFIETVESLGIKRIIIHARKAWLKGLSPKQNREIPPLDHDLVIQMKREFPDLKICINGGIQSLGQAEYFLDQGLDGVMVGRAAYRYPADLLLTADKRIFGMDDPCRDHSEILSEMWQYLEWHQQKGSKLTPITRHMLGLFAGCPGARRWRQELSNPAINSPHGLTIIRQLIFDLGSSLSFESPTGEA